MKTFETLIHEAYNDFTSRERKLADFILKSPGDVSSFSATELARLVEISNSTITRFSRKLGYDNYERMRISARESQRTGSPLFLASQLDSDQGKETADLISQFTSNETEILKKTLSQISPQILDEITTALLNADNLGFLGVRNSHYFAGYARWQFIQFRKKTRLIPGPGETVAERIADLGENDVVIVVGIRRIVRNLKEYLNALNKNKVRVLLIADPSVRGLPADAHWTIICPVENPHVFDSYAGVLAVIRLLAFETFKKSGPLGREYMEQIERNHDTLMEF